MLTPPPQERPCCFVRISVTPSVQLFVVAQGAVDPICSGEQVAVEREDWVIGRSAKRTVRLGGCHVKTCDCVF